ncbi:MAG: ketoacyl-ACP synthase III [Lachnospiraceae bacterium]|nr:ketoacyl-ACP synthase III [Lachnospiraceae bacterium]
MFSEYNNIAIRGIETVVPKRKIDNCEYNKQLGERKVASQIKLTGIQSCYVAEDDESAEDMCVEAAKRLLARLQWSKDEIRGIILITQTPSCVMPSTAFIIQKRLDIGENCIVFDVNLGCSGYTVGLHIVSSLLASMELGSKMLLLVGDTVTQCLKEDDIQSKMMFSDAGTATGLEVVPDNKIFYMQKSMGQKYDKIFMKDHNDYFHMDGMEVFHYTISQVVGYVKEFMERAKLTDEDIDYYVFHQAQKYIVDNVADFCGLNRDKVLTSYGEYGNTAGASIPVTLTVNSELLQDGKNRVLLCGFGVGLSCGIVYGTVVV